MLEKHEILSSTWIKTEEFIRQRMDVLRKQNDGDLDAIQTAAIRGRIRELKVLLGLAKDPAMLEQDGETPSSVSGLVTDLNQEM